MARYGFETRLSDVSFEDAEARVTEALKAEGFGILSEIDVQDTLKKKIGAELRRYRILGACNPQLAKQALDAEPQIGLLLPCNVVVQDAPDGQGVIVSVLDPRSMVEVTGNPAMQPVADEAERRVKRALASLAP